MSLYVHGPIPPPSTWLISPESVSPPGYHVLACATGRRRAGAALVPLESADGDQRPELGELFVLFSRMSPEQRSRFLALGREMLEVST